MSPPADRMKAIVLTGHGGHEKHRFNTGWTTHSPGPGQVLFKVRAGGSAEAGRNEAVELPAGRPQDFVLSSGRARTHPITTYYQSALRRGMTRIGTYR